MEFTDGFTEKEMRDAVKSIEAAGRSEIAHTIYRLLKEAQKDSASYWTNRVEPWITSIWPKDRAMIDARTAKQFALISAAAGTEFERAVEVVEKYLQLIEDFSYVVHIIESTKIDDTPLAQKYPAATLKLLDAIVGDEGGWPDGLRNLLNQISQGDDSLTGLPSYRRLGEYLRRRGL